MRPSGLITTLLLILVFAWLGSRSEDWRIAYSFSGEKNDNYALLARGLQHGHLYMDAAVDPRLFSAEPRERQEARWILDASLYQGHYYLYFGVVPAALVFLPYHWLTGSDISENAVVLLLISAGFLVYGWIYAEARKRYFANLTAGQFVVGLALLAFGSGTPALVEAAGFYEIAIAAAYTFHALTWLGIFNAWHSEERRGRWIGFSSLCAGLAVGCRPNYVLALPAVAAAAVALARRGGSLRHFLAWAVLPASGIGLILASYNYARFGSPVEFGLSYQLSEIIRTHSAIYSPWFFWNNLDLYYLRPPSLSAYFPYVFPTNANPRPLGYFGYEPIHGQLAITILGGLTLAWSWRRPSRRGSDMRALQASMVFAFALMFVGIGFLGVHADRYIVDFQPPLVLLIVLTAGCSASQESQTPGWRPRFRRTAFAVIALSAASINVLASLQLLGHFEATHPRAWRLIARCGCYPSAVLQRLGLIHYGPVRFKFVLPPPAATPVTGPLFSTGLPGYTDVLYVTQDRGNRIEFELGHCGYGLIRSASVPAVPGREYEVEVDSGSLYPPRIHPWFDAMSGEDVEILKTTILVKLDGNPVIYKRIRLYDSSPNWAFFGRNPAGAEAPFNGRILESKTLGPRSPGGLRAMANAGGVLRLVVNLPTGSIGVGQPILGSGVPMHGNLLLLEMPDDHSIQFGLDQWNAAFKNSPIIPVLTAGPHILDIFAGPRVARDGIPTDWQIDPASIKRASSLIRVWLDGWPVWSTQVEANADSYDLLSIGCNPQGFSSATSFFSGSIDSKALRPDEMRDFVRQNARQDTGLRGILRYKVRFPQTRPIAGLPLLGVGKTGGGNLILAAAEDQGAYRIEVDDWGYGVIKGNAFLPGADEHDLEIILGPILAKEKLPDSWNLSGAVSAIGDRFIVFVDGKLLANFTVTHHLNSLENLTPGANPQGFSTAHAQFEWPLFAAYPMMDPEVQALIARAARMEGL